jgi:hypothetical protein
MTWRPSGRPIRKSQPWSSSLSPALARSATSPTPERWHVTTSDTPNYIGYADELAVRIAVQLAGNAQAAALMRAFIAAGVGVELARIWPGATKRFERQLKRQKNAPRRLCPICRGSPSRSLEV